MCEVLERRIITQDLPYDLEESGGEREITRGPMRLSQQALSKYEDSEKPLRMTKSVHILFKWYLKQVIYWEVFRNPQYVDNEPDIY